MLSSDAVLEVLPRFHSLEPQPDQQSFSIRIVAKQLFPKVLWCHSLSLDVNTSLIKTASFFFLISLNNYMLLLEGNLLINSTNPGTEIS